MPPLRVRLAKLEALICSLQPTIRLFFCDGPAGEAGDESRAFLRSRGHDPQPHDIVVRFIGAENGKPKDLPWRDRTATLRGRSPDAG
ncbi:hypothetical protein M446_0802 [Methylobacterium sp. 4-46]|uniref:hypothetical protein n=1 Tax=unclassified Methylobacterium TaxID=2615210 RepID=UPI000165C87B|nr:MULTISPECIES: hypothetical protein [Methylobacterium]ACA15356.1 hypothetical protein M446_0802 [Methylobacterium sp. 4-46]WFT81078.1 hypothetical protein QA634_04020 [Methylobacterium nodulans]